LWSSLSVCGGKRSDANENHAKQVFIAEKEAAEQGRGAAAVERKFSNKNQYQKNV
jgi:hypothetical protein